MFKAELEIIELKVNDIITESGEPICPDPDPGAFDWIV